jgi:hypothetical protein
MDKVETVAPSITGSSVPKTAVVENIIANTAENTSSLLEQIYNNKTYVYILIVVLVLAGIGIYLYLNQSTNKSKENKSKDEKSKDDKSKDEKSKDDKSKDESDEKKDFLNPNKDYYIVDPNGKTILINKYFPKILQSEMQENQMMQQQIIQQQRKIQEQMMQEQIMQQQMRQQQMPQQPIMVNNQIGLPPPGQNRVIQTQQMPAQRPKLSHPGEASIPDVNLDEDDNIANQDLTQTEIDELKRQLEVMQRKQSAPITAENEGNTDAEF